MLTFNVKIKNLLFILLLVFTSASLMVFAENAAVPTPTLSILDHRDEMTVLDAISSGGFAKATHPMGFVGIRKNPVWLKVDLQNDTETPFDGVLEFNDYLIGSYDAWVVGAPNVIEHERSISKNSFAIALRIAPGQSQSLYTRIESASVIDAGITLRTKAEFDTVKHRMHTLFGFTIGTMGMLTLLYGYLSFQERSPIYLVLVMYVMIGFGQVPAMSGYTRDLFNDDPIGHIRFFCVTSLCCMTIQMLMVAEYYGKDTWMHQFPLLVRIVALWNIGVVWPVVYMFNTEVANYFFAPVVIVFWVALFVEGIAQIVIKKRKDVIRFLIPAGLQFFDVFMIWLATIGVVAHGTTYYSFNLLIWVAFCTLFALVFSYKIFVIKTEKIALDTLADEQRIEQEARQYLFTRMSKQILSPSISVIKASQLLKLFTRSDEIRVNASIVLKAALTILSRTNNILDISKLRAGDAKKEECVVDLKALAVGIFERYKGQLGTVESYVAIPENLRFVKTDKLLLDQIIDHLVQFAITSTNRGFIQISAKRAENGKIRLAVRDTGRGIESAEFISDYNNPNAEQGEIAAVDLGLQLVKQNSVLLGGQSGCLSLVGSGTVFWFEAKLEVVIPLMENS